MIIVKNNTEQLQRLLEAVKTKVNGQLFEEILVDCRMTSHDFDILVTEVESDDGVELDDVYEFITNQPECRKEIFVNVFSELKTDEKIQWMQEYLDNELGDKIIVDLKHFTELSEKAKKHATKQYAKVQEVEYDDAAVKLEESNERVFDVFGNVIKELDQ